VGSNPTPRTILARALGTLFLYKVLSKKESGKQMTTQNSEILKWTNILAFFLTVIVNGLAGGTTILGGKLTSEISDANPTLITPAGYVFSIWGIIYILLGIFVVFQALPSQTGKELIQKIGWLFVLSSLLNICWLFLWQFEYLSLSVVLMFLLLASLIAVYLRLNIGKSMVSTREKLAVHVPFSVYLGWITIASIANVSVTLVSISWDGFGVSAETWAILVVIVALIITLLVVTTRKDVAYALVIIWALIGIAVKQSGNQTIAMLTEISAIIVAISLAATILVTKLRHK
jgi:benzodiazapine receptor